MKIQQNGATSNLSDRAAECLALKVPAFAKRYSVTQRTVWTWLKRGMPHLKISTKRTRIPVREADEWVAQNYLRQRERQLKR